MIDRHTMTSGDVARELGVGISRVQQLDEKLKPVRRANGHRRYDPAIVKKYIEARKA